MIDIDLLKKYLHEGIVNVTFTKADGSERVMGCTLKEDILPKPAAIPLNVMKSSVNPDSIRVYDVDIQAWRSFRYDSVKEIKV